MAVDGVLPLGVATTSSLPPNITVAMETEAAGAVFCAALVSVVWSLFEAPPKTAPSPPNKKYDHFIIKVLITILIYVTYEIDVYTKSFLFTEIPYFLEILLNLKLSPPLNCR